MDSSNDVSMLLSYYAKYEMPGEREFLKDQRESGIEVCDLVYQQDKSNSKEKLKFITQLSIVNEGSDLGKRKSNDKSSNLCRAHSNPINRDFYIKEVKVSKEVNEDLLSDDSVTNITTIVGKKNNDFEALYPVTITKSGGIQKLVKHESHLRHSNKPKLYKLNSSNSSKDSVIIGATTSPKVVKKPNRKIKFRFKSFSNKPKMDKKEISEETTKEKKKRIGKIKGFLDFQGAIPFDSYKIKDSSIKKRSASVWSASLWSKKNLIGTSKSSSAAVKEYSTNNTEMEKLGATKVIVTLDSETEELQYEAGTTDTTLDDFQFEPESAVSQSIHFGTDEPKPNLHRKSCPTLTCNCYDQRIQMIADLFIKIINNESVEDQNATFNQEGYHFIDCPLETMIYSEKENDWRQSQYSLYNHCDICEHPDEQLNEDLSPSLLSFDAKMKDGEKVRFTDSYLDIFKKIDCYDHFDEYLRKSVGSKCTPLNLARLHDTTRRIVRHIGNPNDAGNYQIKNIFRFAENYYFKYFQKHIHKCHKSVANFLLECRCNDLYEPD